MIDLYKSIIYLFHVCSSSKLKLPFRIYKKSCIETESNSKIIFKKTTSRFHFNKTWTKKNPFFSHLTMEKNSKIIINNTFSIYPNARIGLGNDAILELGSGFINIGSTITVKKHLFIGENVIIGPNCVIRDTDDHILKTTRILQRL
jgi:acetyltransferase-like isoleucine patch superfamily enzyme